MTVELTQEHQKIIDEVAKNNPRLFGIHECKIGCDCHLFIDAISKQQCATIKPLTSSINPL